MTSVRILQGDAVERLRGLDSESVTVVITDPPYEIGCDEGAGWDSSGVAYSPDLWSEILRVLRPGGQVLAFGHSRGWHHLAAAIEGAGFEIRGTFAWIRTGDNFYRHADVSKTINAQGRRGALFAHRLRFVEWVKSTSVSTRTLIEALDGNTAASHFRNSSQPSFPTVEQWETIRPLFSVVPDWVDEAVASAPRRGAKRWDEGAALSEEAEKWTGYRPNLKTAFEPAVIARKRLVRDSLALTVTQHGSAVFDVEGNRVNGRPPSNLAIEEGQGVDGDGFFVCPKAPRSERVTTPDGREHPTVKPLALMRHLVRLMAPPGAVVLDPFSGSGSTLVACALEGREAIGVELSPDYVEIIRERLGATGVEFSE